MVRVASGLVRVVVWWLGKVSLLMCTRTFVARSALALALTTAAAGALGAQGIIAGIALDEETGTAMPCIDVSLTGSDGKVVTSTQTLSDGAFGLPAPDTGVYRLRFKMWGAHLLFAPEDTLSPDANRETIHRLGFRIASDESGVRRYADSNPNRPPRPVNANAAPEYPYAAKQDRRSGEVVMRYLVNDDGTVREDFTRSAGHTDAIFERAVRKFVHTTEFKPSSRDGEPACALVLQRFKFSLAPR